MKFFCEYCGNRIDALKHDKCPHCGASYKKNKSFIKLEEEKKKQQDINNEYKKQVFDYTIGAMKFSRWFMIIPILAFVIILFVSIFTFSNIKKNSDPFSNIKVEEVTEDIEAEYNEYAETSEYKVKVTKYEVVEDIFNKVEEGYELVKFHIIVENLTNNQIYKEDVNCIVDGIAQTNYLTSGYSDLTMFINKGLTVKGTSTFIVPKETDSYDIKYGDNITIHIEK